VNGIYVLGRDPECDVPVEIHRVSRRHARLAISENEWLLEDLGSSNGTLVDDQELTAPVRLRPGQRIEMGDATLELLALASSESSNSMARFREQFAAYIPEELMQERRYEIGSLIKRGGMGGILDAREATIRRTVAMKVMLDDNAQGPEVRRFIQEAQITGQLEHPNIVPVHELGVNERGQIYYTMKFVDGVTLRDILVAIEAGDAEMTTLYPLAALLTIFQKVCDAVAFAHSRGVVHRDLKPDNLMIGRYGEVLVMDWGLAKLVARATGSETSTVLVAAVRDDSLVDDWRTLDGQIMGTPCYMAPEQAEGRIDEIDAAADIYALGSILYHLLVLESPVREIHSKPQIVLGLGAGLCHRAYGAAAVLKSRGIPCKVVVADYLNNDYAAAWLSVLWGEPTGRVWTAFGELGVDNSEVTTATPLNLQFSDRYLLEPGSWRLGSDKALALSRAKTDPKNAWRYQLLRKSDKIYALSDKGDWDNAGQEFWKRVQRRQGKQRSGGVLSRVRWARLSPRNV